MNNKLICKRDGRTGQKEVLCWNPLTDKREPLPHLVMCVRASVELATGNSSAAAATLQSVCEGDHASHHALLVYGQSLLEGGKAQVSLFCDPLQLASYPEVPIALLLSDREMIAQQRQDLLCSSVCVGINDDQLGIVCAHHPCGLGLPACKVLDDRGGHHLALKSGWVPSNGNLDATTGGKGGPGAGLG